MNAPFALTSEYVRTADLRQPDEAARIEGFVAEMGGSVFHRPAWLRAVESGTGQRARGLVAKKGGAVTGWLPLSEVHSPVFGRMLASSGFAVEGGVLAERAGTAAELCRAAEEYAVRLSCSTVELRGGPAPKGWHTRNDSHCGFAAPIEADDEAQLLAIPRKQRAEVRKGLDNELEVTVGTGPCDRADHYAVYAESVRNLGTPVFPHALFDACLDELDGVNGARVWGGVADVRPFLAAADLVLAPLAIARGVQNKVLEAMAMARAVVLSPEAATGIPGSDGTHFAVGASDDALVGHVLTLLDEPIEARQMGEAARRLVVEQLGWPAMLTRLSALVGHERRRRDAA